MATHERELTEPVDLCTPDGHSLNRDAVGWSRVPLQRANLQGSWGRNKRWDYWGILLGDGAVSVTFADLDYVGLVAVNWADFVTRDHGQAAHIAPFGRGIRLPDVPGSRPLHHRSRRLDAEVSEVEGGTRIIAHWRGSHGGENRLDALVERPDGHESLNVVVPWSATRFQYTSKHQARRVTGSLNLNGVTRPIGADRPAWATLDVGRGRWAYRVIWNWAGGAGTTTDGHTIGIQMGSKWTDGTGVTENGIIVDGRLSKIGEELVWDYDPQRPMEPWHVHSADHTLELTLTPRWDLPSTLNIGVLANLGHQVFGSWSGTVPRDDGAPLTLGDDVIGFAEEISWRW
ncbi:MAG: DUF2804 domain-containing protein [Actinobacteria bacterium]|nr:DUF2804 domain-containing protein [Actinomycetota bacterium]